MSEDPHDPHAPIQRIAKWILEMNPQELQILRSLLSQGGGDPTGVAAVLPPNLPLGESSIAQPIPPDYWETAE